PPSTPVCTLQGNAEYFNDVTLTCKSEEGSPAPVYQWTSYSVENIPRQFPPKTTQKDGVLSLFNISRETSGFFICISENNIGSASCNFTLAVMPASMNLGSTGIIIGAVAAGLLVLGILIFCCCKRKSKKQAPDEGSHGDKVFYDKDGLEVGEPYLDDKSKTEKKQPNEYEDKANAPESKFTIERTGRKFDDDQQSYNSAGITLTINVNVTEAEIVMINAIGMEVETVLMINMIDVEVGIVLMTSGIAMEVGTALMINVIDMEVGIVLMTVEIAKAVEIALMINVFVMEVEIALMINVFVMEVEIGLMMAVISTVAVKT
ncbi:hypothetical protein ATANTOWER_019194, partial [Ataeniobius toweri]|nr:hypothetical protein [Ataeniobius toweri]